MTEFNLYSSNPNEVIDVIYQKSDKKEKHAPTCFACKGRIAYQENCYQVTRSTNKVGPFVFYYHEQCYNNDEEIMKLKSISFNTTMKKLRLQAKQNKMRFISNG